MMKLSNDIYNKLKWIALIAMPAFAVLISGLGQVWGWEYAEQITLTVNLIATFLGALIGVSTFNYNKGEKDGTGV